MATYEELIKQGATPVESQNQDSFSYDELLKQGATPVNPEDQFNQAQTGLAHSQTLLDKITQGVTSVFPGEKVGEAIGTLGGYAYQKGKDLLTGSHVAENYDITAPSPTQVMGDIAKGTALIGGLKIPLPVAETIGGAALKTGLQTGALGALAGGGKAATDKLAWKDIAKSAFQSGLVGAGAGVVLGATAKGIENIATGNTAEKVYNNSLKVLQRIKGAGKSPAKFLANEGLWGNLGTFHTAAKQGIATEGTQIAERVAQTPGGTDWLNIKSKAMEVLTKRFGEIYSPQEIETMVENVPAASLKNAMGEVSWETVNKVRSQLGANLGDPKWFQTNPTESTRATKAVYGAMSDAIKKATDTAENFARETQWIRTKQVVGRAMDIADSKYGVGLRDLIGGGVGATLGGVKGEGFGERIKNATIGGITGVALERGLESPILKTGAVQAIRQINKLPVGSAIRTGITNLISKTFGADTGAKQ